MVILDVMGPIGAHDHIFDPTLLLVIKPGNRTLRKHCLDIEWPAVT
jgi:hypothetical protein